MENNLVVCGKRKMAVAKATIKPGNGKVIVNKRPIAFFPALQQLELKEPLMLAEEVIGAPVWNIEVNVRGGGIAARIEASRLAIARAIVAFTKNDKIKHAFLNYDRHLLIADTRRKETYKPGDSKARAGRQTSYR